MHGQGRPIEGPGRALARWLTRIALAFAAICRCAGAQELIDYRLHIAWGGQEPRVWRGALWLDDGEFSEMRPLGLDPDQPGSFVNQGAKILIAPRQPHRFDGLEVVVAAPPAGVLHIELDPDDGAETKQHWQVPLSELQTQGWNTTLDKQQNHLRVGRAPGDTLRVLFQRDSLVFTPGEPWRIAVAPHALQVKPGAPLRARLQLRPTAKAKIDVAKLLSPGDQDLWSGDFDMRANEAGYIPPVEDVDVRIPDQEGVYELSLELYPRRGLTTAPFSQLRPLAKRKVQLVVVDPQAPLVTSGGASTVVTEFNPAEPRWLERLTLLPQWRPLPRKRRGPWSNVAEPETWNSEQHAWTKLPTDGWIAYSLPVADVELPHVLDIEFPRELTQTIGVSILETNAAGELGPVGVDSGLTVGDPDLQLWTTEQTAPARLRLAFWPRTTSPIVLITNRQTAGAVAFGRLRLEVFPEGLPAASRGRGGRQRIASFARPLFTKNFLAPEALDAETGYSLQDWNTFYKAGRRLVEYLRFAGYDGVALTGASEGSSLYPSRLLDPTPKYDDGVFFGAGQDARRKDVLEMLFRLFDREGLKLIPGLEFATPLPALEHALAEGQPTATGIELVNADGRKWLDVHSTGRGLAPYYNPLDSRVQNAMLAVVEELTSRYGQHESFGGVTLRLEADGYTQLPDADWGWDERTLAAFSRFRGLGDDADWQRQLREETLLQQKLAGADATPLRDAWLQWRAGEVGRLLTNMASLVRDRTDRPLYLDMASLANTAPWQRHLRPALPRRNTIDDAMLDLGLNVGELVDDPAAPVVLRPLRLAPLDSLRPQAVNLELADSPDVQRYFSASGLAAVQSYREPQRLRLESFDRLGPCDRAYTLLLSHFEQAGPTARRHFAHQLALQDVGLFVDGGTLLPMGQEDVERPFFDVFRQLPAESFATLALDDARPVVVRMWSGDDETIAYFVNDSPWAADTTVQWNALPECIVDVLGRSELLRQPLPDGSVRGRLTIEPFGLVALRFASSQVELVRCTTELPPDAAADLSRQRHEIVSRADQIKEPTEVDVLLDPGFDAPLDEGPEPAWTVNALGGGSATLDPNSKVSGRSSLHLSSSGGPVSVISHSFAAPSTGRLYLAVQLRSTRNGAQPPLIMRLTTSNEQYQPFHQFHEPLSAEFRQSKVLRIDDMPSDPDLKLRVSLELWGPGEVWIDDVRIYDKWFEPAEQNQLLKILQVAFTQQRGNQWGECYQTLSGYWPRFLLRHVPHVEQQVARLPRNQPPVPPPPPSMWDRLKSVVPSFRF